MASEAMKLTALGSEPPCGGCGHPFPRGAQMTAVEYDDGEPAGWHCSWCLDFYKRIGSFDPDKAKAARETANK